MCEINHFFYLSHEGDWVLENGYLNSKLYYKDSLHLLKPGYEKLAREINNIITKIKKQSTLLHSDHTLEDYTIKSIHPPLSLPKSFSMTDDSAIGQSECLGRGWDGSPNQQLPFSILPYPPSHRQPCEDFPPLPPPLPFVSHYVPRYVNVYSPVRKPVKRIVNVSRNVKSSFPICKPVTSTHTSTAPLWKFNHVDQPKVLPLRNVNQVKSPKFVKCDYVHHQPPPTSPTLRKYVSSQSSQPTCSLPYSHSSTPPPSTSPSSPTPPLTSSLTHSSHSSTPPPSTSLLQLHR